MANLLERYGLKADLERMNYFEQSFYEKLILNYLAPDNHTIDFWLKTKDFWLIGIKHVWLRNFTHIVKRHRRSIAQRDLHRLFPQYKIRSYSGYPPRVSIVFLKTADGLAPVNSPGFKSSIWKPCHRLIWKKGGAE